MERRRDGAHATAAAATSTGGPAAGSGSRLGTAVRRIARGCLDAAMRMPKRWTARSQRR